jgi:hypothetical protein
MRASDQNHIRASARQHTAEITTDSAGAQHRDPRMIPRLH